MALPGCFLLGLTLFKRSPGSLKKGGPKAEVMLFMKIATFKQSCTLLNVYFNGESSALTTWAYSRVKLSSFVQS